VRLGEVRPSGEHVSTAGLGLGEPTQLPQHDAEIELRVRIGGCKRCGARKGLGGCGEHSLLLQCDAQGLPPERVGGMAGRERSRHGLESPPLSGIVQGSELVCFCRSGSRLRRCGALAQGRRVAASHARFPFRSAHSRHIPQSASSR
jgi:hypothetical protein